MCGVISHMLNYLCAYHNNIKSKCFLDHLNLLACVVVGIQYKVMGRIVGKGKNVVTTLWNIFTTSYNLLDTVATCWMNEKTDHN